MHLDFFFIFFVIFCFSGFSYEFVVMYDIFLLLVKCLINFFKLWKVEFFHFDGLLYSCLVGEFVLWCKGNLNEVYWRLLCTYGNDVFWCISYDHF